MKFVGIGLVVVAVILDGASVSAQTPPAATTTYTDAGDGLWKTPANWDVQVPLVSDDALIATSQTAFYDQTVDGDPVFGTLTLGTNATLQYKATSGSGLPSGSHTYLSDGSHLEFTIGTLNTGGNLYILPSASATHTVGSDNIFRGAWSGSGDLFNVILKGKAYWGNDCSGYSGELRFSTASSSRPVYITGGSSGTGVTTFEHGTYAAVNSGNRMHNSMTLKLVGGSGGSNPKFDMKNQTDTISNVVVESPTGSGPLFERDAGGVLTVANMVTFQGTAASVVLDDTQATPSGDGLVTSNMTFAGTGNWTLRGDCGISISGGTISNDASAIISNKLAAASGFTKAGSGTLTFSDPSGVATEVALNEGAIVFATNANFTGSDYVKLGVYEASFTADFGGSFANIAAVQAELGGSGNFRLDPSVSGEPKATDNLDGTFTVGVGPAAGTIFIFH